MSNINLKVTTTPEEVITKTTVVKTRVEIQAQGIKDLIKEHLAKNNLEATSINFEFKEVYDPNDQWGYGGEMGGRPSHTELVKATVVCKEPPKWSVLD